MKQVYAFKNNLTKSWSLPIISPESPDSFFRQFHDAVILDSVKAQEQHIDISTVYLIGQYDDANGIVIPIEDDARLFYNCQEAAEQLKALKEQINA